MLRVVVAEDEKYVRKGIVDRIPWQEIGYELSGEAETGKEALALVQQAHADVLITDIRMPLMDGLELLQAVRQAGLETSMIIISGYSDFEYAQKAIRLGVTDYLTKPLIAGDLIAVLLRIRAGKEGTNGREEQRPVEANVMEEIRLYIHRNYPKSISGQQLAEQFYLNPAYMSHCFKQRFGVGISQYIEQIRVTRAKELLRAGCRVSQVAERVGYEDASYFARVFKRSTGVSPMQFICAEESDA